MPLDRNTLQSAIKTVFDQSASQNWTTDQVAGGLADAINAFVSGADVAQITVQVKDAAGNPLGTGTQTGTGKLQ